uniref:UPAR/Ly6 domain-containing protein n=1 Tax=Pelusios castaneus TaxID=367368 RepID=A0A8C8RH29_9SAUR
MKGISVCFPPGVCLECEVCEGPGNSCNGTLETCDTGEDMCSIVLTVATLEEVKAQRVFKGCATSSICKTGPLSVTFGRGMTIRTIIACCVGEACRTLNVTVPPADTKPNGHHCPGCYALFTDQCRAETVACTGFQTQCIHIEERITSGTVTSFILGGVCLVNVSAADQAAW